MERYRNSSGTSGVNSFEIGNDYIRIKFTGSSKTYQYSYQGKARSNHVENMKTLARRGSGLNSYINQHVKFLYD
jgi:hypothetical protein